MKQAKRAKMAAELAAAERRIFELKAQLAATLGAAFDAIPKAAADYHGAGVIIQIHAIGGREVVAPVMIRDGISGATVAALQDDLARSFELATLVNPGMARRITRKDS